MNAKPRDGSGQSTGCDRRARGRRITFDEPPLLVDRHRDRLPAEERGTTGTIEDDVQLRFGTFGGGNHRGRRERDDQSQERHHDNQLE